ncbi:MAG: substrate-binding domain-containing protein [Fibrobacter sp.]|nr:substrate-binding domain-containing protein [Fibrobacter sp.]
MKNFLHSTQPTIAIVIPVFWSGHFSSSLHGIFDAASQFNNNVLCFQGAYFNSSFRSSGLATPEKSGDIIFDLISDTKIDGLIIHSDSLRISEQKTELITRCKKVFDIPIINVGSGIDDTLNILIDNNCGMYELLDHLIHDHSYRNFGFIRGPVESKDAEARLAAFRKTLVEHGFPVNESLITEPLAWSYDSGRYGVRALLSKSTIKPDVIVCASDLLATGALHELAHQKITVPDEISVVGFNNSIFTEFCIPTLTTVSMKPYERSWHAVKLLNGFFNGEGLPDHDIIIPPSLVLRKSCGCQSLGIQAVDQLSESIAIDNGKAPQNITCQENHRKILKKLKLLNFPQPDEIIARFVQSFCKQINDFSRHSFIHGFSTLLRETVTNKDAYMQWHLALSILEDSLPDFVPSESLQYATECIKQGRVIISDIAANDYKMAQIELTEKISFINSLNNGLIKSGNLDCIINHLSIVLPKTDLLSFYLSLYDDPLKPLDRSRLVFAYNEKRSITLPDNGISFSSSDILPDSVPCTTMSSVFFIEPLFYGENQIGFALFEIGSLDEFFYTLYPSQLSASLWSVSLLRKKEITDQTSSMQAQSLAVTNDQLNKRTIELQNVLMQLQQNHERILASEKMSSLGRFTAGIIHEMNTPLSTLSSSIDKLKTMLQNSDRLFDMENLLDRKVFVNEISDLVALANKAVIRSTDFIRSIKAQSREVRGVETQTFDIIDIIKSVITFLSHAINDTHVSIEVSQCKQCAEICGSPTRFTQVITNLFTNALDAIGSRTDGVINVTVAPDDNDRTIIRIEDNGCGIDAGKLSNIFDPSFTTKPLGKGNGLGLSIVYEIITVDFGGSINVESTVNKGTTFTLCIKNNLKGSVLNGSKI